MGCSFCRVGSDFGGLSSKTPSTFPSGSSRLPHFYTGVSWRSRHALINSKHVERYSGQRGSSRRQRAPDLCHVQGAREAWVGVGGMQGESLALFCPVRARVGTSRLLFKRSVGEKGTRQMALREVCSPSMARPVTRASKAHQGTRPWETLALRGPAPGTGYTEVLLQPHSPGDLL